jgi:hypothetical protein
MLVRDLQEIIKNAPKWAHISIDDLYFDGFDYWCEDGFYQSEIKNLESDIKANEKIIAELEEKNTTESQYTSKLAEKIDEYEVYFSNLKDNQGKSFRELLERNQWQEREIIKYQGFCKDWANKVAKLEKDLTNARARKNKAIVKRCLTTGQLIAEYDGIKYKLVKE